MFHRAYSFHIDAIEIDENGQLNPNTTFYVNSDRFKIVGGHRVLGSKEIAGITVGTIAGLAWLAGMWVVGARLLRKRRSLAVDMSEQNGGGYSDNAGR